MIMESGGPNLLAQITALVSGSRFQQGVSPGTIPAGAKLADRSVNRVIDEGPDEEDAPPYPSLGETFSATADEPHRTLAEDAELAEPIAAIPDKPNPLNDVLAAIQSIGEHVGQLTQRMESLEENTNSTIKKWFGGTKAKPKSPAKKEASA